MSTGIRAKQSSFSSDVSSYLIHMSCAQVSFFETPPKKSYNEFLSDTATSQIMHYDPNNVGSRWWGDHNSIYAANYTVKDLVDRSTQHVDYSVLEANFGKIEDSTATQMARQLPDKDPNSYKRLWRSGLLTSDTTQETETIAIWFDTNGGKHHRSAWSRTVYLLRSIVSVLGQDVRNPPGEAQHDFNKALEWAKTLFDDPKRDAEVLAQWLGAKQMFLLDYIAAVRQNLDPGQYIVSNAKKRIYRQLMGAGGFIVEAQGRKFELSSSGYGSSGLYYREFVLAETTLYGGEQSFEASVSVGVEVSVEKVFSASASFSYGWSKNWSVETSENPTEWKRVREKTFLDRISPSDSCTYAQLILFMNWYVGGLSVWIQPLSGEKYGGLMLQEPFEVEVARFVENIKIDSPFKLLDVFAAVDTAFRSRKRISPAHIYEGRDKRLWIFKRKGGGKLRDPDFSLENAKSVIGIPKRMHASMVE